RERYWGTPLPVWKCEEGHIHVIGSREELKSMAVGAYELPELHRPYIDQIVIRCPHCGKDMHRVKEVIDCWYDSGAMPFAQWHYPFENKETFEKRFPANFISEAVDQTRGWFYTLLAESTLLFDQNPFENCIVMGHVQDKDGRKMSKHLGNVVDPWSVLDKLGADAVRWYFYTSAPWLPSRFYEEAVSEAAGMFMGTLWNTYAFFILYAEIDGFDPKAHPIAEANLQLMDKWILSRLNSTIRTVDECLASYQIPEAAKALTKFVDDLSNWYVRRCRERFWGKGMAGDKEAAFATLYHVLETLSSLIAPFVPFMAESIYQNLVLSVQPDKPESVHLTDFPKADESLIDPDMERQMEALIEAVQLGRACRSQANLKVRQPLNAMYLQGAAFGEAYASLAEDELNVKKVEFVTDSSALTSYKLKPQLKTLGPKFGKLLGKIREALANADGNAAVAAFERGEDLHLTIDGGDIALAKQDVLTEPVQKEGLATQSSGGITVALDTLLTDDLIREGYAREVISKLQTMRKDAGFDVTDRILVTYAAEGPLAEAFETYHDMIAGSVLASAFEKGEADPNAFTR
ncbi:MAG: class I tRNA ligase family protein, partial [Clostridia bacterium]|nr:class I tRNA ligase family protein [Clostridia bacterium]